jgi:hypothetical protein
MRAVTVLKGSSLALAGLGIALGLSLAANRQAGDESRDAATALCSRLNIGDETCSHAYLTKPGFDRVFADVESASSLSLPERAAFAEKLRLAGTKRVAPGDHPAALNTRIVDDLRTLIDLDTALHLAQFDEAAIFSLLLEDPTQAPSDKRLSSISDPTRNGT